MKQPSAAFRVSDAFALTDAVLAAPPARLHIVRPEPRGTCVARFGLPLEFCQPMNRIARRGTQAAGWALAKYKSDLFALMASQHRRRESPLPGRPQVLCMRVSSLEPDKYSDWQKNPVDRLRADSKGLGFIVDDRPSCVDLHAWWEPGPRGNGCVLIEVWSG